MKEIEEPMEENELEYAYVPARRAEAQAPAKLHWETSERITWMQEYTQNAQQELYHALYILGPYDREQIFCNWVENPGDRTQWSQTVDRFVLFNDKTRTAVERWEDRNSPFSGLLPLLGPDRYKQFLGKIYKEWDMTLPDFADLRPEDDMSDYKPLDPGIVTFCQQ